MEGADNKGYCVCPQCSILMEYVCANDGITYPNECETRRKACMTKSVIKVVHGGKCGKCSFKYCNGTIVARGGHRG